MHPQMTQSQYGPQITQITQITITQISDYADFDQADFDFVWQNGRTELRRR